MTDFAVPPSWETPAPVRRDSLAQREPPVGGLSVLVAVSWYYPQIANRLVWGATRALSQALEGRKDDSSIRFCHVSGALELPQAIQKTIVTDNPTSFDMIVALGCVIRGETGHYDVVVAHSAAGLMRLALDHQIPIGNGILTVDSQEQAIARADPQRGDKGGGAVWSAVDVWSCQDGDEVPAVLKTDHSPWTSLLSTPLADIWPTPSTHA